ncbi:hypothetical protein AAE478_000552 [Parahypoxylon ruwenzoriense]
MSWKCRTCGRCFVTWEGREQHIDVLYHSPLDYECNDCNTIFAKASGRGQHEVNVHFYCRDCDRHFMNANNIRMHLNSRTHRGSNIVCPFCKRAFATATGLSHHLEGGHCPSAPFLNCEEVYKLVRSKDPTGVISKKLIDWQGPSATYEATGKSWNGWAYECYFCHRSFAALNSLNQHLNSPAHQQPLYHCPNRNICGRDFKTLAAVMNHLESESCGYTRFENVQTSVSNIVSSNRRLTFN